MARDGLISVSCGWEGEIAEILEIHMTGSRDGRLPKRDVLGRISERLLEDRVFLDAIAGGDEARAHARMREVAVEIITPGLYPDNAPSTAARKGGDKRALRNAQGGEGHDRVLRDFQTWTEDVDPLDLDSEGEIKV